MNSIARWWGSVKGLLFRGVEAGLEEPLTEQQREVVAVLEVADGIGGHLTDFRLTSAGNR